jgi:hypothetical protein
MVFFMAFGAFRRGNALIYMRLKFPLMFEWVMERQGVRVDADSGIVNDTNDWAVETMKNPRYPLELLLRVVTVSLETMKIVRSLPPLEVQDARLQKAPRQAPGAEPTPA